MLSWTQKPFWATGRQSLSPTFWKVLSGLLLLCLIAQQFALRRSQSHSLNQAFGTPERVQAPELTQSDAPDSSNPESGSQSSKTKSWTYSWDQDRDNHGLSEEQCDAAFPQLWNEIDRAKQWWLEKKINMQDIDLFEGNDGGVRLLIHDSQLRIIQTRGLGRQDFRHRIIAVVQQILRAITAAEAVNEPIPDIEFTVIVDDKPVLNPNRDQAMWAFTRAYANQQHDSLWVMPDFHFFGAPPEAESFKMQQTKCRKYDALLTQKLPKVVWRGAIWVNEEVRKPLLNVTEGKEWADVKAISWEDPESIIPMDAFCQFRYVVNTEGRAWSARMTHLLNCDSLLLVHDVEWIAHYYHLLDTEVNCVHVQRDFSDLEEKITYYDNNTEEAQKIADTARETFRERYTTPAATACYWRKMMRAYSDVAFTPITKVPVKNKDKLASKEKTRGISFEEFIVHDNTVDYPYLPKPIELPKKPENNG